MRQSIAQKLRYVTGIAGVFILVGGIAVAMQRARLGFLDDRPISYLGLYPNTHILFSTSLIVSALLFIVFGLTVAKKFSLGKLSLLFYVFGQVCQIIVALVPDQAGSPLKIIHTVAGFGLAFSLPVLMRALARSKAANMHHSLYLTLYRIEQIAIVVGIGLFISVRGIAPLGEALPNLGLDLWIIVVTYTTFLSYQKIGHSRAAQCHNTKRI